jgi:hypothetical protein
MKGRPATLKTSSRIRRANRRLVGNKADPRNADRSLWGEVAVVGFASITGLTGDVEVDPGTVLCDLLADLMHWCAARKTKDSLMESVDFESALERAREHYSQECADERKR